ncbi:MAG: hypothetical protein E6Q97_26900 [Desulfurellales bacterium]|nr:MAG: hypothetical protein E6Q97_26900 [Desulfurellales bacterium]
MRSWIPDHNIAASRRQAQQFWETPAGGYGSGWAGGLAAALSGLGSGLWNADANAAERSNQGMRADLMKRAAGTKDNLTLGTMLMGSGIPGMDERGLSTIVSGRERADDRAFQEKQSAASRAHAERMLGLQGQQALSQARAMMPLELEKLERRAGLELQAKLKEIETLAPIERQRMEEKLRLEYRLKRDEMEAQARALGLAPASPDPQQGGSASSPIDADMEARKQKARAALMLGDKKAAVEALNSPGKAVEKFLEKNAESLVKDWDAIRDGARSAAGNIGTIQMMRNLVSDPSMPQGPGSGFSIAARKLLDSVGIPTEGLNKAQMFEALANGMALKARTDMPGAMSDGDRQFLLTMAPNLGKTPQGNAMLLDMMERVERRKIEVARMASNYAQHTGGAVDDRFFTLLSEWSAQRPLFPEAARMAPPPAGGAKANGAEPVPVQTPEDAMKLPPGTPIRLPDGSIGRVPDARPQPAPMPSVPTGR